MADNTRFQIATPYIAVQSSNAFVELYAIGEAVNWKDLEPEAIQAVSAQGGDLAHARYYQCPTELAARAQGPVWLGTE
jgi:hypothetical protein